MNILKKGKALALSAGSFLFFASVALAEPPANVQANLPFVIPSLPKTIGFLIRFFFVVAGIIALIYLLLGAFAWITSGGNKEGVEKAREKIQAAIIGLILIVVVLALLMAIEQFVFKGAICFGLSCDLTLPNIIEKTGS